MNNKTELLTEFYSWWFDQYGEELNRESKTAIEDFLFWLSDQRDEVIEIL